MGAKLTAPRLLRAMEGAFEGTISASPIVSPQSPYRDTRTTQTWPSPSWLDIVNFAKTNPNEFTPVITTDGRRVCHFIMNNNHVEITEDDWRLIMTGVLDRFFLGPGNSLDEDEAVELATLDILEKRLLSLIKQADDVAVKARQLNYHLSGRRKGITTRRANSANATNLMYPSLGQPPPPRTPGFDLHADLLRQFLGPAHHEQQQAGNAIPSRPSSMPLSLTTPSEPPRPRTMPVLPTAHPPSQTSTRPSPIPAKFDSTRDTSGAKPPDLDDKEPIIPLIIARIEKLPKGAAIMPPCDRCRRLNMQCFKHLTACQGCTRKHAKCYWKELRQAEMALIRGEPVPTAQPPQDSRTLGVPADDTGPHNQHEVYNSADGFQSDMDGAGHAAREISSRQRVGFTPTPPTPTDVRPESRGSYGTGAREMGRMFFPEHADTEYAPERGKEVASMLPTPTSSHRGGPGDYQHPQHLLLSHMATAATLAVEANTASVTGSRGSSTGRD